MNDGQKLFLGAALMISLGALMIPYGGYIEVFGWHAIAAGVWWSVGFAGKPR